jgi:hypothetical protein
MLGHFTEDSTIERFVPYVPLHRVFEIRTSLVSLRRAIIAFLMEFSLPRIRNAEGWTLGP